MSITFAANCAIMSTMNLIPLVAEMSFEGFKENASVLDLLVYTVSLKESTEAIIIGRNILYSAAAIKIIGTCAGRNLTVSKIAAGIFMLGSFQYARSMISECNILHEMKWSKN